MERDKVAVFGDLTSLYSFRKRRRHKITYANIDNYIKKSIGVDSYSHDEWYTLFDGENTGQVSFVKTLTDIGWKVKTIDTRDVRRVNNTMDYRFDARISFSLGVALDQYENIVVVSDSYEIKPALELFHKEDPECKIHLAFYPEGIDSRWIKHMRDNAGNDFFNFIDLSQA